MAKDAASKLAQRIYEDPTRASVEDARKLARAVLLLTTGRLPEVRR
jgi:hypothetical protein